MRYSSRRHEPVPVAADDASPASPPEPAAAEDQLWPTRFWRPRYWPAWCLYLWLRACALLPFAASLWLHECIGRTLHRVPSRVRRTVRRNLELCFASATEAERRDIERGYFESLGAAFAECSAAWFMSSRRLRRIFDVAGTEHIQAALRGGHGVILYTGHFTTLEICGRPFKELVPRFECMFSRRNNALLDELQRRGRLRSAHRLLPSDDVRALLKSLRRNAVVWYAPDQTRISGNCALIPFFGEPAMTSLATSKLARLSRAAVVPFSYRRVAGKARYELRFGPQLADFPSADPVADTRRLVDLLETAIIAAPAQYMWQHRRFRSRPEPLQDPYR